jgi:hypothetical protein
MLFGRLSEFAGMWVRSLWKIFNALQRRQFFVRLELLHAPEGLS